MKPPSFFFAYHGNAAEFPHDAVCTLLGGPLVDKGRKSYAYTHIRTLLTSIYSSLLLGCRPCSRNSVDHIEQPDGDSLAGGLRRSRESCKKVAELVIITVGGGIRAQSVGCGRGRRIGGIQPKWRYGRPCRGTKTHLLRLLI